MNGDNIFDTDGFDDFSPFEQSSPANSFNPPNTMQSPSVQGSLVQSPAASFVQSPQNSFVQSHLSPGSNFGIEEQSPIPSLSANDVEVCLQGSLAGEQLLDNVLDDPQNSPFMGNLERLSQLAACDLGDESLRNQIQQYTTDFTASMTVRKHFKSMIERKCWNWFPNSNQVDDESVFVSKCLVNEFSKSVDNLLSDPSQQLSVYDRDQLFRWNEHCKIHYSNNSMEFVNMMRKMLEKEQSIIMSYEARKQEFKMEEVPQGNQVNYFQQNQQFSSGLNAVFQGCSELNTMLTNMRADFEKTHSLFTRLSALLKGHSLNIDLDYLQRIQNTEQRNAWSKVYHEINMCKQQKQKLLETHMQTVLQKFHSMVTLVLDQVSCFKFNMALKMIGEIKPDAPQIDRLQDVCKLLGRILQVAVDQMDRLLKLQFSEQQGYEESKCQEVMQHYQNMFKTLVQNCVVIDKHPGQVIMKEKKFVVELRHLMGTALPQTSFETTVVLINSATYTKLKQNENAEIRSVGQIKVKNQGRDGKTRSTTNNDTGQVTVKLNNMSISIGARGGDKTKSETVAEEKLTILFTSEIPVNFLNGDSSKVVCRTYSLPLVVTTHGKQEADANATIFWDNAFQVPNRVGFETYDQVEWGTLMYFLDKFWRRICESEQGFEVCQEGRGLDNNAQLFLKNMITGNHNVQEFTVTRAQFSKNQLRGKDFSFWTWFYKVVELVSSQYVKKFWKKGFVEGFISRQKCEHLLSSQKQTGTFLLRFSESHCGSLVITVLMCNKQGKYSVMNLEPDNINSFKHKRSLPGNMKDLTQLVFLYPNRNKEEAFREFWEPERKTNAESFLNLNHYFRKTCKVTVEQ